MNPLFSPDDQQPPAKDPGYVLPRSKSKELVPPSTGETKEEKNAAIELIRHKLEALYEKEPTAARELSVVRAETVTPRSPHQQFMYNLSTSGKPLAQIQVEWHNYYLGLPDAQKHEVWREFYSTGARDSSPYTKLLQSKPAHESHIASQTHTPTPPVVVTHAHPATTKRRKRATGPRSVASIKKQIQHKVQASASAQAKAKQHLQSLLFGIVSGVAVLAIFLFGFFNETIIAPFIQPSRHVSATPIIISENTVAPSETPEIIIPKINVQIPAVYDEKSVDEAAVQRALERGIIHYPSTVLPGQKGNAAYFGHSSNNIFNKGKYKFAFVLLHELVPGDIFYVSHGGKLYSYRVFNKKVVEPDEISVLNAVPGKPATVTLITCDPPGTSLHRLVVWGEQISPDPSGAAEPTPTDPSQPSSLPDEGPTMLRRFIDWLF